MKAIKQCVCGVFSRRLRNLEAKRVVLIVYGVRRRGSFLALARPFRPRNSEYMFSLRTHIERSGFALLVVLLCGAVAAPFGHELSHICSLEHAHGEPAEVAHGGSAGMCADFLVEERTPPHVFACDLCAFCLSTISAPDQLRAPRLPDRMAAQVVPSMPFARLFFYQSIRAPPGGLDVR